MNSDVLTLAEIAFEDAAALLAEYGLQLVRVDDGEPIPGSYWGETEAGIIGNTVYARADTPIHSLLHEAGHLIVLPPARRAQVHTDATDSIAEEEPRSSAALPDFRQIPAASAVTFGRAS